METIIIAFNFLCAVILDFMMSLHCPIVSNKRILAYQQQSHEIQDGGAR